MKKFIVKTSLNYQIVHIGPFDTREAAAEWLRQEAELGESNRQAVSIAQIHEVELPGDLYRT